MATYADAILGFKSDDFRDQIFDELKKWHEKFSRR